ncbi:MAG: DNA polymerase III subunit epsilon [Magnetococcales bacterium]|nr:DNA polymerase III subunit epsilon [Magnetococcales bacterium]
MKRLIVLDTETTGLSPAEGDRIVEIGCLELLHTRKGESFQQYINPERDIPPEAVRIHGISNERVADQPRFADVVERFLAFIGDDPLIIHNASFDMGFLNAELARLQRPPLPMSRVIDTMLLARRKYPGLSASLDALCRRLKVDNSHRVHHGALLDAHLLADVYVELVGGNQLSLDLGSGESPPPLPAEHNPAAATTHPFPQRTWPIPAVDRLAHQAFLARLHSESAACIWLTAEPPSSSSSP